MFDKECGGIRVNFRYLFSRAKFPHCAIVYWKAKSWL